MVHLGKLAGYGWYRPVLQLFLGCHWCNSTIFRRDHASKKIFDLNITFESSNYLWNLSQTCSLFCISNKHHDIIVFASCFKTTTPSTQPQETSHDCPCWRTWPPGHSQSPRKYSVASIFLSSFAFIGPESVYICLSYFVFSYIFPFHLFAVPWSVGLFVSQLWFGLAVHLRHFWVPILRIRPAGLVRKIEESLVSANRFDLFLQNSKLKNHASLEELRWDHSEEKIQ